MKAVIMAGGEGTRLRPLTCEIPKPMVPVLNVPVMEHIINLLKHHGITEIAVTLQYLPNSIRDYFKDGSDFGVKLLYSVEESPLGTAGSVKNIEDFLDETFLVVSGDALTDFNLSEVIKFHKDNHAIATITMTTTNNPLEFGIVLTDPNGRITRFLEKPSWSEVFSDTINTGIYVLEPEILQTMDPFRKYDFSKDIFPYLLKENYPLFGFLAQGYWCDIGNLDQYKKANFDALVGKVKIHSFKELNSTELILGADSYVSKEAEIEGPVLLGKNCKIHRGTKITGPTIIGDNCVIDMGASVKESILWNGIYVGENTKLSFCQIGHQCLIKDQVIVREGSFLGDRTNLGEASYIKANCKIWPNQTVKKGSTVSGNIVNTYKINSPLFTSHGVSGIINSEITPEFVARFGAAFGSLLKPGSIVVVSRDGHFTSNMIKKALEAGLESTGVNILDLDTTSLSLNSFAIRSSQAHGGVHICTSYTNPNKISIHFLNELGIEISTSTEKELDALLAREGFRRALSSQPAIEKEINPFNIIDNYSSKLLKGVHTTSIARSKYRIAGNFLGHLPVQLLSTLSESLNYEMIFVSSDASLTEIINLVVSNQCDFGVYCDENDQNLKLITATGEILSDDIVQEIFIYSSLKSGKNKQIITTVCASSIIDKLCCDLGGKILRTKTDSRVLKENCLSGAAALGGDATLGFIFPEVSLCQDSLAATVKLLELLATEGLSLKDLVRLLPPIEMFRASMNCDIDSKGTFMRRLIEEVKDKQVELFDGVKIIEDNSWFLVLPDPHQPILHLFGEGGTIREKDFLKESLTMVERIAKETNAG